MSDDNATAGPSTSEAVEELLRQLVDARFVLTDREGAVTRWSRPAEELFGWPGARMLGRPLAETLGLADELPTSGGCVEAVTRRKDGHELEVALTLVPVRMSQSLEFNGFLEALEIAAPRGNALIQLSRSHRAGRCLAGADRTATLRIGRLRQARKAGRRSGVCVTSTKR